MTWYDFNEKIANVIYRLFKKALLKSLLADVVNILLVQEDALFLA